MKPASGPRLFALLQSDFAVLALLAVPAIQPLVLNGGLPNTADGALHLFRTFELARAWADGVLYPRIAPDFAYGYGYPIFNYYAPLFYFLSQAFHVVGINLEWAVKLAIVLTFYAYPVGMYLWVRDMFGAFSDGRFRREAALAAGVAYLYAPYRFYEAFIQGDYPQFLALALVPFCLWAATPSAPRRARPVAFVLAYGALVVAHNITALIATPLIGVYMLFVLARGASRSAALGDRLRYALTMAGAVALAVGLTAFFWWPALGEQQYVRIEKLTHGFFDFRNYFLSLNDLLAPNTPPDIAGVNPYIPFNLGPVALVLSALVVLLAAVRALAARVRGRHAGAPFALLTFCVGATLALAAMTLPLSTPLWSSVPLLPLTEFPWRFVGLAAVPLAALVGLALRELRVALDRRWFRWGPSATAVVAALLILDCFVYLFPRTPFIPYGEPSLSDLTKFELGTQAIGTTSAGEYLPIWTAGRMYDSPLTPQMLRDSGPDHLQREALPVTVLIDTLADNTARLAYHVNSKGDLPLRIQRIYFPGWRATIDGKPAPLQLITPNGVMQVLMPEGEHTVEFAFGDTPLRQTANFVSLASLVIGFAGMIWLRRRYGAGIPAHAAPIEPAPLSYRRPLVTVALLLAGFWFVAPGLGYVRYSRLPDVTGMQHPSGTPFGEELRLLGYDLSASSVTAGNALALTFYWQPLRNIERDYAVFAHLDNPLTLETVAQTWNERPGNISTLELPLSMYVRDPHVMNVPADVAPGLYLLRVGMLNPRSGQALTVAGADGVRRTRLLLQPVRVRAAAPPDLSAVTRADARFGGIELVGYTLDPSGVLVLYWRAAQTPDADATVFVHLLGADGKPAATFDGPPAGGLLPTSAWEPGEVVADRRVLKAGADGPFRIAVGLYDPQSTRRYPAQGADGAPLSDDQFVLDRTLAGAP
ncbi:MAG: hypothetical protein HZB53_01470 [Chloroflexi bacterium]|nr:hypothetical protein [Chloroflexota bacterium]